jgi:hypothetical protein
MPLHLAHGGENRRGGNAPVNQLQFDHAFSAGRISAHFYSRTSPHRGFPRWTQLGVKIKLLQMFSILWKRSQENIYPLALTFLQISAWKRERLKIKLL